MVNLTDMMCSQIAYSVHVSSKISCVREYCGVCKPFVSQAHGHLASISSLGLSHAGLGDGASRIRSVRATNNTTGQKAKRGMAKSNTVIAILRSKRFPAGDFRCHHLPTLSSLRAAIRWAIKTEKHSRPTLGRHALSRQSLWTCDLFSVFGKTPPPPLPRRQFPPGRRRNPFRILHASISFVTC